MNLIITFTINLSIKNSNLKEIIKAFRQSILTCFQEIVIKVIQHFANEYMRDGTLAKLLKCSKVTWKTCKGAAFTSILTIFGKIKLPQLQVKNHDTGSRQYITRLLLGIKPMIRIPEITIKMIGLMGALAPYRVVKKIASMFTAVRFSLMTILRCIRKTGKSIVFDVDEEETNVFEADGTGIPIIKAGKRGKELKILAQRKRNSGIRIAGMNIDKYKSGWDELFSPLKEALKRFVNIFLITDGDTSPLDVLEGIKVILQRCLFHIPHETKYTLWQDKVKRKSEDWRYILGKIFEITNVKRIREDEGVAKNIIKWKRNLFTRLINFCSNKQYKNTTTYFRNAKKDLFSGIERRVLGGTISLIERVMRTVNMRINVGKWSPASALAVCKIRGAYYYNGFDI